MSTDTSPSASEIAATLTTACVHAWQAMGRQGASIPTNAMHAAYAECQTAIESAGPGLHLRCAEAAAEIARLQAQVAGLRSGLDVWSATAGRAQARATELQAQVVKLAFLVQTAPKFFSAHSFDGEKLLWLKRAGLVPKDAK